MEKLSLPEPLESLLEGIESKAVTTFFGGPGVGKTNICLLAAVDCVRKGGKVVYFDTEGGLSEKRLEQICKAGGVEVEEALKSIEVIEPKSFVEQRELINQLQGKKCDLVVLDSAVALYRLEYAQNKEELSDAQGRLSKQLSVLSVIAREKNIPVIVTAHTYKNWSNENDEVVGGELIKYWSKALVFLERTGRMSERIARVVKHRHIKEGREAKFLLVEEGLSPVKFKVF